ncbi:hypothetical protein BGX38DRAFT_1176612 [Terfezia claveryi]|nr:hypothetical protein BGX38DRAFT_1176612 [Terfezia claveryi]
MQAATALPFAAGVILLATVTLNAANPKRNRSSKVSEAGYGGFGASGAGVRQINHNRATSFSSQEFSTSLSSARRSPTSHSRGHSSSRHTRTQSMNRNIPHIPSATTSMGDILHSRNPSSGGTARSLGIGAQHGGPSGNSKRVQRKPGHHLSQSLPEFTYPGASRSSTDARRPAPFNAAGFLGGGDPRSENRDQRLPATLFK